MTEIVGCKGVLPGPELPSLPAVSSRGALPQSIDGLPPSTWFSTVDTVKRRPVAQFTVAPWHATGLLNLSMHGQPVIIGSGFMCAPDVFLTARHNLTSKTFDAGGVWIAYDAQKHPTPQQTILARAWHSKFDLGVLILGTPQKYVLPLGVQATDEVELAGYGYPYVNGTLALSEGAGLVNGSDGPYLAYGINTQLGDSGAPVIAHLPGNAVSVVAVHTTAAGSIPGSNFGTLLTPQAIADLTQIIQFARDQIQH